MSLEKLLGFSLNICSSTSGASLSSDKKGENNANPYFHPFPNAAASSTEIVWLTDFFFCNKFDTHERAQIDRLEDNGQIPAQNSGQQNYLSF